MAWTWSKPFHGVQHLETGTSRRPQFTVEDHGTFTEAVAFAPGPSFAPAQGRNFDTPAEARAWLERIAVDLYGLKEPS